MHTAEAFLSEPLTRSRTLEVGEAQRFASAVWDAQCPTESRAWRLSRVEEAMRNKGYSMEGVIL